MNKKYEGVPLKRYSVSISCWSDSTLTVIACTSSQAKYKYYVEMDSDTPFRAFLKFLRVKCLGVACLEDWFGPKEHFERVREYRRISFAVQGMRIDVDGQLGYIVGGNCHSNLDVLMDGTTYVQNCHPHWETTYYNLDGTVAAEYKKQPSNQKGR